jgi:phage replication-related protein YjqB (UPF0714/DUF867 family)
MLSPYRNYQKLSEREIEGQDYRIRYIPRPGNILVMAPHGGKIEPGTSEIAESISLDDYSLYSFEGLKSNGNSILHIESHLFDEPRAIRAIKKVDIVITVHGHSENRSSFIMIGGLNTILSEAIKNNLEHLGYTFRPCSKGLGGKDPNNICNRGRQNAGVQLEISKKLRESLKKYEDRLYEFAQAIREAIQTYSES